MRAGGSSACSSYNRNAFAESCVAAANSPIDSSRGVNGVVTTALYSLPQGQGQAMKLHTDGERRSTTIAASSCTGAPVNIARDTLLLSRRQVAALANSSDYLLAMQRAFEGLAAG